MILPYFIFYWQNPMRLERPVPTSLCLESQSEKSNNGKWSLCVVKG